MDAKDRIIVALDVDDLAKARSLVESLAPHVGCFKVGLELQTAVGAPQVVEFIHSLGGQIFYDGKLGDIPNTVARSARVLTRLGVKMFNIHCMCGIPMMRAAYDATKAEWLEVEQHKARQFQESFQTEPPLILGVTLLTSLNFDDLVDLGVWHDTYSYRSDLSIEEVGRLKRDDVQQLVASLARSAQKAKLDGVVCSPQEIEIVRKNCGPVKIITPGIRGADDPPDDQKRTMTAREAILAGADYLVIGRPITKKSNPVDAVKCFEAEISESLEERARIQKYASKFVEAGRYVSNPRTPLE